MFPAVWDYIVVGGGLAGTVISNRLLSYNSSLQILLIEAGRDASHDSSILYHNSTNLVHGTYDWAYLTTPQPSLNNRHIDAPAGHCLGGGTAINGAAWYRGDRTDYNDWADVVNDTRWNYDNMLQYFKMTEQWFDTVNEDQHGQNGKVHVSSASAENRTYPLQDAELDSWRQLGVPVHADLDMNIGDNIGVGELNTDRIKGLREIANTRYPLDGITVLTSTWVQSVVIDTDGDVPVATGVELKNGTIYSANEVIVSAGSFRSPQILMLSGVGPQDTLEEHNGMSTETRITVKHNAPQVGQNFLDHFQMTFNWELRDPSKGYAIGSNNTLFHEPQYSWNTNANHVASTTVPVDGLAAAFEVDEGAPPDYSTNLLLRNAQAMNENVVSWISKAEDGVEIDGTHVGTTIVGLKPTSRGSITISSARIESGPVINPNYYATEVDKYSWRTGIRNITELMAGNTTLGTYIVGETPPPGFPALSDSMTDAEIDARVAAKAFSTYHPMGSCAMGKVVDTDLRVLGVNNLRVADASVIPIAMGAHTQAPTYALAEHAAAIIAGVAS
ncbi:hypothetical protein F5Y18DRAFT_414235 [Xylariaceae sp. FL1019]|nr:hypothetical protein F5Y18DRAFT_414235 [Xylariaceae sp. FL1019]